MSDDDTTTFELTRRRILGGALTIGAASAATGAGTLALFSDTEQSSGNTVQAGTLDLTTNNSAGFPFSPDKVAPGEPAGSPEVDLQNSGTTEGDHVEFAASITGEGSEASEGSDSDINTETSGEAFAKHVFVKSLQYGGSPVNWEGDAFTTLVDDPGAVVFDDMTLDRVSDPAGGGRDGVLRLMGTGYGLSMRSVSDIQLDQIGSGTVTLDWRGGANNVDSAPDEIYAVIEDTGGTRHLVYHTANYDSNNDDDNGQTWRTIDIGTEMGLASGTPYNSN
ncbi:MAG: TasA family protein, partial [Halobaculum sp.]